MNITLVKQENTTKPWYDIMAGNTRLGYLHRTDKWHVVIYSTAQVLEKHDDFESVLSSLKSYFSIASSYNYLERKVLQLSLEYMDTALTSASSVELYESLKTAVEELREHQSLQRAVNGELEIIIK